MMIWSNMIEKLPISIDVCDELVQLFVKIPSVTNKLEAQFNFQTMTANWYHDEHDIWFVHVRIETPKTFMSQMSLQADQILKQYSDDAFSHYDQSTQEQILVCYIAITETELIMLHQQHNLLTGLLNIKIQKVLNLIAKQLKLDTI